MSSYKRIHFPGSIRYRRVYACVHVFLCVSVAEIKETFSFFSSVALGAQLMGRVVLNQVLFTWMTRRKELLCLTSFFQRTGLCKLVCLFNMTFVIVAMKEMRRDNLCLPKISPLTNSLSNRSASYACDLWTSHRPLQA